MLQEHVHSCEYSTNTQQTELSHAKVLSFLSLSATGKQRGSPHGGMPFADLIPEHLRPYQ